MIARPFDGVTVVTVNDLSWRLPGGLHPDERVTWIERRLPGSLAQAARLVAISEFTAHEMVRHLGVSRDRIDVVPLAPSEAFRLLPSSEIEPILARHGLAERGFVLSVSTLEPRKNFDRLLAAHARLPAADRARQPLVIAGGRGGARRWPATRPSEPCARGVFVSSATSPTPNSSRSTMPAPPSPIPASTKGSGCRSSRRWRAAPRSWRPRRPRPEKRRATPRCWSIRPMKARSPRHCCA